MPEKRQRSHHSPHLECGRGDGRLLGKRLVCDSYFCGGRLAERQRAAVLPCSYHDAFVYVNGEKAGEHLGSGYTPFEINITEFLVPGENTVTVCARN